MSNTKQLRVIYFMVLFTFYFITNASAQYKITDTVYYNKNWEITEKPIATYYRAGLLVTDNNAWFYSGQVKDYTIDNTPAMEGEYSTQGQKQGDFIFYYPDGKKEASGKYAKNAISGNWYWYYPNGSEKAIINFPGGDYQQFQFVKFTDLKGSITLENGTGKFNWFTNPFDTSRSTYIFSGSFSSGKRTGDWRFDKPSGLDNGLVGFTEKYNDEGKFEGTISDKYTSGNIKPYYFNFSPALFSITESIKYDDVFNINGEDSAINNIAYCLIEHKLTEIDVATLPFDTAFARIMKTINQYRYKLVPVSNGINGKLEFNIGAKGCLENIKFTTDNLDTLQKKYFSYLLGKYKNISLPKGIDDSKPLNFTIYFTLVKSSKAMTIGNTRGSMVTNEVICSFLPHEKISNMSDSQISRLKTDALNYHNYLKN